MLPHGNHVRIFIAAFFFLFAATAGASSDPTGTWPVDLAGANATSANVKGAGSITFNGDFTLTGFAMLRPAGSTSAELNIGFFLIAGTWEFDAKGNIIGIFDGTDPDAACGPADATFTGSFKGAVIAVKKPARLRLHLTMTTNNGLVDALGFSPSASPPDLTDSHWQAKITISTTSTTGGTASATRPVATQNAGAISFVVGTRTTATTVQLSSSTVKVGQSTTATLTVTDTDANTASATTPSGTVSLTASGVTFGTSSCTLNASGTCTVTATGASAGTQTITATYNGDVDHNTSIGTATLTVQASTTTTQSKTLEFLDFTDPSGFGDPDLVLPNFFKVDGTGPAYGVTGCALITPAAKIFTVTTEDAGGTMRFLSGKLNKKKTAVPLIGFDDSSGTITGVMNPSPSPLGAP